MEVILLKKVPKLGNVGSKVRVKPGHARNYLIPQGKALPATEKNLEQFEATRAELEKASKLELQQAEERKKAIDGFKVTIAMQAGEEGRLFGSVTAYDIVRALTEAGHKISKNELLMPAGPMRQLGEYEVTVYLYGEEVTAKIIIAVIAA